MPVPDLPSSVIVEEIFRAAAALPATERAAYLFTACEGRPGVRARVERMLGVHGIGALLRHGADESVPPEIEAELARLKPEEGGERIGNYKLLQQIGEGGFGIVWMAEQIEPVRRKVALKIIKLGMDTREVIARFEQERQALALMDHPNIAKVFDAGATPTGRPFFVMELVHGVPLTDYCDEAQLPTADRLQLFIAVCQAVQHAHQKGIIHRDLKPSNILVTLVDGAAVPKVIDFGVAKATQQQRLTELTVQTGLAQMLGTPLYMSPEQAEMSALDIDTRSDIYSLGVLLYELLTGRTPFNPEELMRQGLDEMCRAIREQEPPKPSTALQTMAANARTTVAQKRQVDGARLIGQIRGDLDWIVMKALEKDRTRRYETANALALDIQRHLASEPVLARPSSQLYRLRRLARRNRVAFAAAGAVVAALVAGFGMSTWSFFKERAARANETIHRGIAEQRTRQAQASESKAKRLLYASDMNFTQQALQQNQLGKARRLLERARPQPGEEDLRGWEWRYLWQLSRGSELATLTHRPDTRGFSLSFSLDGARLAVGWNDGHVELWDVPNRRLVRALTDREHSHPGRVAFSPVRNLLAATSEPKIVTLYDLDSGGESILWRAPAEGEWAVRDLGFSRDGSRLVIYAGTPSRESSGEASPALGDAVWVVNVSSAKIESHHPTTRCDSDHLGAARLSPDNQRLYLGRTGTGQSYTIHCIDLTTGKELWKTETLKDWGLATLDVSQDGRWLASGAGFFDSMVRVWDTATGQRVAQLEGRGWVCKVAFTADGRRLISAAADQTLRIWDTSKWTELVSLRGHTDEVHTLAISEAAHLIASGGADGSILLWSTETKKPTDSYRRLDGVKGEPPVPMDAARVLLLPWTAKPQLLDLAQDTPPKSLPEIATSAHLGAFGTHILQWSGPNQIIVRELVGTEFIQRGVIKVSSGTRPARCIYHPQRQLLAWSEGSAAPSISLASLAAPEPRSLKSDLAGLSPSRFSEEGTFLAATKGQDKLRVWNIETGQLAVSLSDEPIRRVNFAAGGRVLVVAIARGNDHEIRFYDLVHPDQAPKRVRGTMPLRALATSPDGGLVAAATVDGRIRLFDPVKGEVIDVLHGHLRFPAGLAFSPDGLRLISSAGGPEAVKLWDVRSHQELLTLSGSGADLQAPHWSADGNAIINGEPWQAWRAPSWEEIAEAEAKEKTENKQP